VKGFLGHDGVLAAQPVAGLVLDLKEVHARRDQEGGELFEADAVHRAIAADDGVEVQHLAGLFALTQRRSIEDKSAHRARMTRADCVRHRHRGGADRHLVITHDSAQSVHHFVARHLRKLTGWLTLILMRPSAGAGKSSPSRTTGPV
jgi:hypothetical protein